MSSADLPCITVLLATRNGVQWLPAQLDSVLRQEGVRVTVVVSDDMSTDGTWEWLQQTAAQDERVRLLPRTGPSGSAAQNFYRLLRDVRLEAGGLMALADQDDVWLPGKLAGHAAILRDGRADGVSSNVTAFWPDGRRTLLRKDFPQRRWDFLFEGPGPGCTFLLSERLAARVQRLLVEPSSRAARSAFHDWLVYAVCRGAGWRWHVDPTPTVDYRQHDANTFGANLTVRSGLHRLRLISASWHRREATVLAEIALETAQVSDDPDAGRRRRELEVMLGLLRDTGPAARARLAGRAPQLRRRPRDRVLLGLLVATGVW